MEGISKNIRRFGRINGGSVGGADSNALGGAAPMVVEFVFYVYLRE